MNIDGSGRYIETGTNAGSGMCTGTRTDKNSGTLIQ